MDRKWMSANRLSKEYKDGVQDFIRFAVAHAENPSRIICPCLNCCYTRRVSVAELEGHLVCYGIDQSYKCWTKHGEPRGESKDMRNSRRYASNDTNTNAYEVLARALDVPEYRGCLRSVGFPVTQKDVFPPQKRPKQSNVEEMAKLKSSKQEKEMVERHEPNLHTTPSAKDSSTLVSPISLPEGIKSCKLFLSSPTHRMVGIGKVYNELGETLQNQPLPFNHVKVGIEVALEGHAPLPVPIEEVNMMTIEQAIGIYVAWPINLIVVNDMILAKSKSKINGKVSEHTNGAIRTLVGKSQPSPPTVGKGHTKGSIASRIKNGSKSQPSRDPSQDYLAYLRVHVSIKMQEKDQMYIDMEEEILGYRHTIPFGVEELNEVLNHEQLCQYVLSIYMRYLYREVLIPEERTRRFVFLCPDGATLQGLSGQPQYIADRLAMATKEYETLFLAPCNVGGHWVLLVINPIEDIVYYLDPLQHSYLNRGRMLDMFNSALKIYRGHTRANVSPKKYKTKWIFIECPRQTNNIDCGYYVMKFMKEIVVQNQMQIPTAYFPDCKSDKYSVDQLIDLKQEWCHYFVMNYIN